MSIYATTYGKVLLVITREDDHGYMPSYHIDPFIQTCNITGPGEIEIAWGSAEQDLAIMNFAGCLPSQVDGLEIGDRVRIWATYLIEYSRDYWGEYDFEVSLRKTRTLRRQPFNPKRQPYFPKRSVQ